MGGGRVVLLEERMGWVWNWSLGVALPDWIEYGIMGRMYIYNTKDLLHLE